MIDGRINVNKFRISNLKPNKKYKITIKTIGEIFGIKYATNPSEVIEIGLTDRIPPMPVISGNNNDKIIKSSEMEIAWDAVTTEGSVMVPEYSIYLGNNKKNLKRIASGLKGKNYFTE